MTRRQVQYIYERDLSLRFLSLKLWTVDGQRRTIKKYDCPLCPYITGTKLNYRPGKRPKLDEGELSSNVDLMEFDEVKDDDAEDDDDDEDVGDDDGGGKGQSKKKSKKKLKKSNGGQDEEDADLQFAESFNPFMRFSRGDLDNMDKEVADLVTTTYNNKQPEE